MKPAKTLLTILFIIPLMAVAQKKSTYWSMGTNPLSIAESGLTIGVCGSYTLSKRYEVWAELSAIVKNNYFPSDWKRLSGYRFILQPRYTILDAGSTFIAPELRIKGYSFNNTQNLINEQTNDTLSNYKFKESQFLIGSALIVGTDVMLSKKHRIFLEITGGIGGKYRTIKMKDIPAGYVADFERRPDGLAPNYEGGNAGTVYFPVGFRLMWHFDK